MAIISTNIKNLIIKFIVVKVKLINEAILFNYFYYLIAIYLIQHLKFKIQFEFRHYCLANF